MTLNKIALSLGLVLALMGCATQLEEEIGQCEPGLEDIGHLASTVTPAGC